nr:immunoglobulin light chain junction region [Macaca mulatta]
DYYCCSYRTGSTYFF